MRDFLFSLLISVPLILGVLAIAYAWSEATTEARRAVGWVRRTPASFALNDPLLPAATAVVIALLFVVSIKL